MYFSRGTKLVERGRRKEDIEEKKTSSTRKKRAQFLLFLKYHYIAT